MNISKNIIKIAILFSAGLLLVMLGVLVVTAKRSSSTDSISANLDHLQIPPPGQNNFGSVSGTVGGGVMTRNIGIYESSDPGDPQSLVRLAEIRAAGFNVVLNYALLYGTTEQVSQYLDRAERLGIKVIINLSDYYAGLGGSRGIFGQCGSSDEALAICAVQAFKAKPAVWGWYISDEKPETLADLPTWKPVLQDRYRKIKAADPAHPTLVVLSCYQGQISDVASVIKGLGPATDQLGLDSYPVPYDSIQTVGDCSGAYNGSSFAASKRWSVVQSFSWSSYPDELKKQGRSAGQARYPTKQEMKKMVDDALAGGVGNVMFYSYFDMKVDIQHFSTQWAALKEVVSGL